MLLNLIPYIAVFIQLFGVYFYIRDMVRGKTKPNRISWSIWALAPLIGCYFAWRAGAGWSLLPAFMAGFNPVLVLIASFVIHKGYSKVLKLDIICGGLAILALILWLVTRNFSISILFAIASDALAAVPTLKKSWNFPETETYTAYLGGIIANILGLFLIKEWTFPIYSLNIYFILINLMLVFSIYKNKFYERKQYPQ